MANLRIARGGDGSVLFGIDALPWAFSILAALLFIANTRHGIGILPDTTRYMQIVSTPYDAPLYPWILSTGHLVGIKLEYVALAVGFVLCIANTLLVFHLFRYALPDRPLLATIGTLLIVINPTFLWINTIAMSEPLFLALMLFSVTYFLTYMRKRDRGSLALASLSLGLAMLARFVAPPIGASFAVIMLFYNRQRTLAERIFDATTLFVVSAGIFLLWAVGSKLIVGRAVGRELWFYGNADSERWLNGLSILSSFLLPTQIPQIARLALLLIAIGAAIFALARAASRSWGQPQPSRQDIVILFFGFFNVFYAALIVLSVLIEANLQLNSRYALPFYIGLVFVLVVAAARFSDHSNHAKIRRGVVVTGLALFLAINVLRSMVQTAEAFDQGVGFQSHSWRTSPTIEAVRALPADAMIFSNGCDALNFLTKRAAQWTPSHSARRTGMESDEGSFEEQLQRFRQSLLERNAYVVFFDAIDWRFYRASEPELVERANLRLIRTEADGRIYQADATALGKQQRSN
ncbi:glycosyltransferase family 39 protein [Ensifer sp. 4252]|uniref:glycosyltransferase family 39 protein n=1 Tax=Ensifer sp. 4252 TaxID=3373915 RepID=UPI003D193F40